MRDLRRLVRILAASAALAVLPACVTEKPVVEATGVPVGGGVNVPPGSNEDFIVNVGRRIYFAESSADLDDTAKVTLQKQADWLSRYAQYRIKIEGFADDRGAAEGNKALGLRRADVARAYLASLGIAPHACARRPSAMRRSASCTIATTSPAAPEPARGYGAGAGDV